MMTQWCTNDVGLAGKPLVNNEWRTDEIYLRAHNSTAVTLTVLKVTNCNLAMTEKRLIQRWRDVLVARLPAYNEGRSAKFTDAPSPGVSDAWKFLCIFTWSGHRWRWAKLLSNRGTDLHDNCINAKGFAHRQISRKRQDQIFDCLISHLMGYRLSRHPTIWIPQIKKSIFPYMPCLNEGWRSSSSQGVEVKIISHYCPKDHDV